MLASPDSATSTAPPATTCQRIDVIINAGSGAADKEPVAAQVRDLLSAAGVSAHVVIARTADELMTAARQARDGDAQMVVAGGGDGTISSIAGELLDTGKTLGVLPLGTFNYFAKRLGVPLDPEGAVDVLLTGRPANVTIGEVNGRVFLNNSSIGLYPSVLKEREQAYLRIGRSQMTAYLSAALVLAQPPALMNLHVVADGVPLARRTPLLFVGANPEQLATFGLPAVDCLHSGQLAAYMTRPLHAPGLWRLALRALFRGLHGASELEAVCARELVVTLRRRRVRVAVDGEVVRLAVPLRFRFRSDLSVQHPA